MKAAYVTTSNPYDIHSWSGLTYYIFQALKMAELQVETIGPLKESLSFLFDIKSLSYQITTGKHYRKDRENYILNFYAKQVENALKFIHPDIIFSPDTIPIAYLKTNIPIVFWTDSSFAGLTNFYPKFSNLCSETIKNGHRAEQEALTKSRIVIYSTEWAAKTAINNYDVDPRKVKVVPFGANIDHQLELEDIQKILNNKDFSICKLLFIGVDWLRKGGDIALKVAEMLNKKGMKTELHIVGCIPPIKLPNFVIAHGFLSKKSNKHLEIIRSLFIKSHFLILPSKSECYGVVFAEASSFGLPSLSTNVGGISEVVRSGINGQTFPAEDTEEILQKYCDYIFKLMSNRQEYIKLSLSSFKEYTERLNWTSSSKKVRELIREFCN